jgi:hypothetical protein
MGEDLLGRSEGDAGGHVEAAGNLGNEHKFRFNSGHTGRLSRSFPWLAVEPAKVLEVDLLEILSRPEILN